jgi:hypothetical protein
LSTTVRARAERLITVIRDRAFAELARRQGELAPMALTMDDAGRLGIVGVYTGDAFPSTDNQLAHLQETVRRQAGMHGLESAATAHQERVLLPYEAHELDAVCVQFETRKADPLCIFFAYRIKIKLIGDSEITRLAPVTRAGTRRVFPASAPDG